MIRLNMKKTKISLDFFLDHELAELISLMTYNLLKLHYYSTFKYNLHITTFWCFGNYFFSSSTITAFTAAGTGKRNSDWYRILQSKAVAAYNHFWHLPPPYAVTQRRFPPLPMEHSQFVHSSPSFLLWTLFDSNSRILKIFLR